MKEDLLYVLGVAVSSGLLVTFYRTALHGRVSFAFARVFLLGSLAISAVVPALEIPVWRSAPIEIPYNIASSQPVAAALSPAVAFVAPDSADVASASVGWLRVFVLVLYVVGVLALVVLGGRQIVKIFRIRRWAKIRNEVHHVDGYTIVLSNDVTAPFSFLSTIYVARDTPAEELNQLVMHEGSHIRHRHSVEKIAMEALKVLFWFSPATWWAARLLSEVHEFQADSDTMEAGCPVEEYLHTIFRQVFGVAPEIATGLGNSLTKKRFEMMKTNLKHSKSSWLRAAGVLPIAAGMLALFGFTHRAPEVVVTGAPEIMVTGVSEAVETEPDKAEELMAARDVAQERAMLVQERAEVAQERAELAQEQAEATQRRLEITAKMLQQPDEPTYAPEETPKFQGGDLSKFRNWVMEQIVYPQEAVENGVSGVVTAKFVIEKDGTVGPVEVLNSPSELFSNEVARVISTSPAWTPGTKDDKPVRVFFIVPIEFAPAEGDQVTVHTEMHKLEGQPLYVVDGRKVTREEFDTMLKPDDIESVSVLKNDAATTMYGEDAEYGVIIVETKDYTKLDEQTETGYGKVSRRARSSSVNKVDMSEINKHADLRSYLQGRVAGVQFFGDKLIVRGLKSVNNNNEALILIDGMPVGSFEEANEILNPNDIESVSVTGSTNIYGQRGANGVVLIVTKKKVNN